MPLIPVNSYFSFADLANPASPLYQLTPPARLALLGTPVGHSKSPEIHNENIRQLNLPWRYVSIEVKPEELAAAFDLLRKNYFIGFNLTMPHKQEAVALVDEITEHARLLGGINTVVIREEKFYGSNTDGPGFVVALKEEWNFSLKNKSILLLGASGGAGRALTMQSALENCYQLFLCSRTPEILQQQVQHLLKIRPDLLIETINLDEPSLKHAMPAVDLIVNATSVGFLNQDVFSLIPTTFFQPHQYLYDIIYSSKPTPLIKAARAAGARATNGWSMLQFQGIFSFQTWLGKNDNVLNSEGGINSRVLKEVYS